MEGLTHIVEHNAAEPGLVRLYVTMSAESTGEDNPARNFFTERYNFSATTSLRTSAGVKLPVSLRPQSTRRALRPY